MKRTRFADATCPIARSLDAIGDWWSLLVVRDAFLGRRRFGEFQKSLGMARNILADRLKKLTECGVLETVPASDGSAYHEYVLTEKGRDLFAVTVALRQWAEAWLYEEDGPPAMVDRKTGKPLAPLEVKARDGRTVGPADVALALTPTRPSKRRP